MKRHVQSEGRELTDSRTTQVATFSIRVESILDLVCYIMAVIGRP